MKWKAVESQRRQIHRGAARVERTKRTLQRMRYRDGTTKRKRHHRFESSVGYRDGGRRRRTLLARARARI